jgi:rhodanese-related sulfurtransferase
VTSSAGPATVPVTGAELDVAAFKAAMAVPGTVVLDVRTPQEHATGFLANSVNIDVTAPDFSTRVAALDKSLPYAVFCRSGSRSKAAVAQLAAAGFTRVYHLGGGIQSWVGAGEPVVLP